MAVLMVVLMVDETVVHWVVMTVECSVEKKAYSMVANWAGHSAVCLGAAMVVSKA